ncbi:GNAT family N-acetyltransferase [Rhodophyticola porphyridii]|uniref:GNAT family N-acetyltransferase n=1 Tax=Rhodophyticola porphyridii TaxID=1852017 RepID=A0A3L9Y2F5_9RHOB|nr:GNAT family N-acetyltransferase [Rhodophyticola porphyridii]RMA43001.1 GNAT family N-acetyltransferase [Rhodophyticola porphyridii]
MTDQIILRPTTGADMVGIDALLAASYPVLLKPDYPPSVLVTALPLISRANPGLLRSGTFYVVEDSGGRALAAGGWTHTGPQGGIGPRDLGHIRHVVTHPCATRRGLARALLTHAFDCARAAGITRLSCQSTRTAVPFYAAMGFEVQGDIEIALRPGITFPAVQMMRNL